MPAAVDPWHNPAVPGVQVAEFVKTFLGPELASAYANDEPKEGPMTDKRLMKVTEAVFQRMDSRIATELAGATWGWGRAGEGLPWLYSSYNPSCSLLAWKTNKNYKFLQPSTTEERVPNWCLVHHPAAVAIEISQAPRLRRRPNLESNGRSQLAYLN